MQCKSLKSLIAQGKLKNDESAKMMSEKVLQSYIKVLHDHALCVLTNAECEKYVESSENIKRITKIFAW